MLLRPPPIPNSYWATPFLCASEYPFSPGQPQPQLDKLLIAGIRTFIDLTEPQELIPYESHLRTRARAVGIPDTEHLWYYRFPIRDRSTPPNDGQTMLGIMAVLQVCTTVAVDRRGANSSIFRSASFWVGKQWSTVEEASEGQGRS